MNDYLNFLLTFGVGMLIFVYFIVGVAGLGFSIFYIVGLWGRGRRLASVLVTVGVFFLFLNWGYLFDYLGDRFLG